MDPAYIATLNRAYDAYFDQPSETPVLTIECDGLDFVNNPADLACVADRIQTALGTGAYQAPLPLGSTG
jgi:deoxyadenosine/deoxycytidine kinase